MSWEPNWNSAEGGNRLRARGEALLPAYEVACARVSRPAGRGAGDVVLARRALSLVREGATRRAWVRGLSQREGTRTA
jgi:hypothetical protein